MHTDQAHSVILRNREAIEKADDLTRGPVLRQVPEHPSRWQIFVLAL